MELMPFGAAALQRSTYGVMRLQDLTTLPLKIRDKMPLPAKRRKGMGISARVDNNARQSRRRPLFTPAGKACCAYAPFCISNPLRGLQRYRHYAGLIIHCLTFAHLQSLCYKGEHSDKTHWLACYIRRKKG